MTSMWEPATDTEQQMREALRAGDQDSYFKLLSRCELLLPLSAGQLDTPGPPGNGTWATWTTEDRTHVLAFTSEPAMRACLRSHAGAFRMVRFTALVDSWPDESWWLAVDPGLPIEGYLPSWFVHQMVNGGAPPPPDPVPQYPDQPDSRHPERPADGTPSWPAAPVPPPAQAPPPPPPQQQHTQDPWSTEPPAADPWQDAAQFPAQAEFAEHTEFPAQAHFPEAPRFPARASFPAQQSPVPLEPPPAGSSADLPTRRPMESYESIVGTGGMTSAEPAAPPEPPEPAPPPPPPPAAGQPPPPVSAQPHDADPYRAQRSGVLPSEVPQNWSQPPVEPQPAAPQSTNMEPAMTQAADQHTDTEWLTEAEAEQRLGQVAHSGDTARFLHIAMRCWVYLPIPDRAPRALRPGEPGFQWHTETVDGTSGVTVFTSTDRLVSRIGERPYIKTTLSRLVQAWPTPDYALYLNPGTDIGANMPGPQTTALINWASPLGLLDLAEQVERQAAAEAAPRHLHQPPTEPPIMMQKVLPHHQVTFFRERGYDRVAGFVYKVADMAGVSTPAQLYLALGLLRGNGDFAPDDESVHLVRWPAYRTELYQVPYGGNDEHTADTRGGWVVEPPPFRGDGLAPSEGEAHIAEYKVDSVRLPHGSVMMRIDASGSQVDVATFDADRRAWLPVGESESSPRQQPAAGGIAAAVAGRAGNTAPVTDRWEPEHA